MGGPARDGVVLRSPRRDDGPAFLALRRRNRAFLEPWEPLPPDGVEWDGPETFERLLATADTETSRRLFVCRASDGVLMGQISLGAIVRGPLQQCFLGYWIGGEYSGRGYMTAAIRLALRVVFVDLGLHRVEANIQPHNTASLALVRRCGFRLEGFSPKYLRIGGAWADHERWAMTREDFDDAHERIAGPGATNRRL